MVLDPDLVARAQRGEGGGDGTRGGRGKTTELGLGEGMRAQGEGA